MEHIGDVAARILNGLTRPERPFDPEALPLPAGVERHRFGDRVDWLARRRQDVTASAAAALLRAHPYMTVADLYLEKTGRTGGAEETPPMRRGRLLEPVALQVIREDRPDWHVVQSPLYYRDAAARIGGTPDIYVRDPERGFGIVQVKSVEASIFRQKWRDPETQEMQPPIYAVVQAIVEMRLTGAQWGAVAAIVIGHGVEVHIVDVPAHAGIWDRVRAETDAFWSMIARGDAPPIDPAQDAEAIRFFYGQDDGSAADLSVDNRIVELVEERARLKLREADGAEAAKVRKQIDLEIIAKLGAARTGRLADGRIIEAPTIHRKGYQVQPASYRTVKIKGEAA